MTEVFQHTCKVHDIKCYHYVVNKLCKISKPLGRHFLAIKKTKGQFLRKEKNKRILNW